MVVKCRGCDNVSFRYVFKDYESAYPISDDEWDIPETIENYPKFIHNHQKINGIHHVPDTVLLVYQESLTAIQEEAVILAGLGLRGTIEAICNDLEINGKNLEIRISNLAKKGFISQKDVERLHAIRFMGNDAAHEIKQPNNQQIKIALRIIEHLVTNVYILDAEAKKNLDTIVTEFDEFKRILSKHLKSDNSGDEYPLAKFLGKDVRRTSGFLSQLENQLITEINNGNYTELSIGKTDKFGSNPNMLQHFKLV